MINTSNKGPTRTFRILLTAIALISADAAGAADISVVGAASPAGGGHTIALVSEQDAFEWPIILRRNDSGDTAANVRLDVTPLIGPSARAVENQRLLIDGQPVPPAGLDLASLGQAVVTLSGRFPVEGDYKGQLGVIVGTQRIPYEFTITRRKPANPPKIAFSGAGSDGRLALTTDRAAFQWPILMRRDDAMPGDVAVTLGLSPLAGPSGTLVAPALLKDGRPLTGPLTLPPLGQALLQVSGRADLEGAYTGEITFALGGIRTPAALTLNRTHPEFDLKVDPIAKVRDGTGTVNLRVRVQNLTGAERTINPPIVARLDRTDASSAPPAAVGAATYAVSTLTSDGQALPQPLVVAGDAGLDMRVGIEGVSQPGSYTGALRFTAPDRKPLDVPFELSVRLGWWWAVLAIAAGAIASALLRYYQQTGRPLLLLQRDALDLRAKLSGLVQTENADLAPRERQVIARLLAKIDETSDTLTAGVAADSATAAIAQLRRKLALLPRWIAVRRRHDALRPASVANAVEPILDTVFQTLQSDAPTEQQFTDSDAGLNGIETTIRTAFQSYVAAARTGLNEAIVALPADEQADYAQVREDLDASQQEATAGHIGLAGQALDRARLGAAKAGANLLRGKLAASGTVLGFADAEWAAFRAEITRLLDRVLAETDADTGSADWAEASRRYLIGVVGRANARITSLAARNIQGTADAINGSLADIATAQREIGAGHLTAARTAYDGAIAKMLSVRAIIVQAGGVLGVAPVADAQAPGAGTGAVPPSILDAAAGAILSLPLGAGVTLAQVARSLKLWSIGFAAAMLVLAVLSGMQVLYVGNPVFGYLDLVVAFLWGAGLHALAGQSFQGLQGLAQGFR